MSQVVQATAFRIFTSIIETIISRLSQKTKKMIFLLSLASIIKISGIKKLTMRNDDELIDKVKTIFSFNMSSFALRAPYRISNILWIGQDINACTGSGPNEITRIMPKYLKYDCDEKIEQDVRQLFEAIG